ncbi:Reverse transcriptase domain [Sesbania bispinosa]|nr:Reverse transcriptase domain [Sesbania bispinosa]
MEQGSRCTQPQAIPPTLIDLQTHTLRSGLGPMDLKQLRFSPEFIGLTDPKVILDYPSPERGRYDGISLDLTQIQKCKMACKIQSRKENNKIEGKEYYVEFPEYEEIETENEIAPAPLQAEQEVQLITGWNKSLSLKRSRPEGENSLGLGWVDHPERRTIRRRLGWKENFNTKATADEEKVGLHPQQQNIINLFRDFLTNTGLMDLELKGCKFTWQSNPINGVIVKEKIDRVLVNWPWRMIYEHAMAQALPAISSYHSPILFWPKPNQGSGNYFKFEAKWEEHQDCDTIVREGWEGDVDVNNQWERTGSIANELNEIVITLVPKTAMPENLDQYKPISCCNFLYKVISKVIVRRLKPMMPKLVTQNQRAFVGGRQIQDNLVVAQEVFNWLKKRNGRRKHVVTIKLDLSKACDRMEWPFIQHSLLAFGFDSG